MLVRAKHIIEYIHMAEFLLLAKLHIKFSTDYYLQGVQREFKKLGDTTESVDLAKM